MCQDGRGKGMLKPSGKDAPIMTVDYEISHHEFSSNQQNGLRMHRKLASVRFLTSDTDTALPLGDYDLLVGDEIVRLKHIADHPKWLVLSSFA
jgi:hypothetical protein